MWSFETRTVVVRLTKSWCCPKSSIADIAHLCENGVPRFQVAYKPHMSIWEERAARNEALFRAVNEEIRDVDRRFGVSASSFICECADDKCVVRLSVPPAVYTATRANSTRFLVAPDHEDPSLERVVERHDGFFVVEKFGTAGDVAERLDTRGG